MRDPKDSMDRDELYQYAEDLESIIKKCKCLANEAIGVFDTDHTMVFDNLKEIEEQCDK